MVSDDVYVRQGFGQRLQIGPPVGLLIVDFIHGFVNPDVFGGGNIAAAASNAERLLLFARQRGWFVTYSRTVFADDGADANLFTQKIPGNLLFTDTSGYSQIIEPLRPREGEVVVRKQFPSAFFGTPLASLLAMKQVKTLVIAGATTSGCVRASVVDAMCYGFAPIVASDCVGDRSPEQHESNLFDMRMKYSEVLDVSDIEALRELALKPS